MVRKCSTTQILNPATGRCVSRSGKIGKRILASNPPKKASSPKKVKITTSKQLGPDGEITNLNQLIEGKPFFRKYTKDVTERHIASLIQARKHPNIVKIYAIGNNYIDMEILNTDYDTAMFTNEQMARFKASLKAAKDFLQSIGVVYLDWKIDNFGVGEDGVFKVFDFDTSATYRGKVFTSDVQKGFLFRKAEAAGYSLPLDVDNYIFSIIEYK
jgi:serine/threonine protein kinase